MVVPVFVLSGAIPLAAVLEPIGNLRGGESGGFGQFPLLSRRWVRIVRVPLAQHRARLLLEAIRCFLSVPDGARQRELAPHPVLAYGP